MKVSISTTLSGRFRILTVEERFDKNRVGYLIDEKGAYYVRVDLSGETPTPLMPVSEAFKKGEV